MSNTTIQQPGMGEFKSILSGLTIPDPAIIQVDDFFQKASILHPFIIGTIILFLLFSYLRLSSNRSIAPMTVFDQIISVAMGSTLAGVVNGTALVRGVIALSVLFFWQYLTSYLAMQFEPGLLSQVITAPALVIVYRGRALDKVMHKHRVSNEDLYSALRSKGVWDICQVEVVAIEPNGGFSIFLSKDYPKDHEPDVLWKLDGYRVLREHDAECEGLRYQDSSGQDGEDHAANAR